MRRTLTTVALTALAVLLTATSAYAGAGHGNGHSDAGVSDQGVTAVVSQSGTKTGGHPTNQSGSGSDPGCGLVYIPGTQMPNLDAKGSTNGTWVIDTCKLGYDYTALQWVWNKPGRPAAVAPTTVARRALASAPWPAIGVTMNPPGDRLVVNFPIWLSLRSGWRNVSATAAVGGLSAHVVARPQWSRWAMGDEHSVVCHGAGTPYDPDRSWDDNMARRDFGYTYHRSSADATGRQFTITVTVHYTVAWTSSTGAGGSLGGFDRTTSLRVTVGQVETLDE